MRPPRMDRFETNIKNTAVSLVHMHLYKYTIDAEFAGQRSKQYFVGGSARTHRHAPMPKIMRSFGRIANRPGFVT